MSAENSQQVERALSAIERLSGFASPAALRNAHPIVEAVANHLPAQGDVVEIAAGTGFHSAVLAAQFPNLTWQPSDVDPQSVETQQRLVSHSGLNNLKAPVLLDVEADPWPVQNAAGILCCNMIHIAPWSAAEGLFCGGSSSVAPGAPMILYGPFSVNGEHTAPSNAAFDQSLRARNPDWGVRDTADVDALAVRHGFELAHTVPMPANNMIRIYRRHA